MNLVLGLVLAAALSTNSTAIDPPRADSLAPNPPAKPATARSSTPPAKPAEKTSPDAPREAIPLFLQTVAPDHVGATYVARFREALRGSRDYRTVTTPSDARFILSILTMDPAEDDETPADAGRRTVAAVTLQHEIPGGRNQFVYSWVLVAKPTKVDILVDRLLEAIDQEIRDFEGLR